MAIDLDYVKTLPIETVFVYALRHMQSTEKKRDLNRAYRQLDRVKMKRRAYYYERNDIYHPQHYPIGTVEKRHKRPVD